MKKLIFTLILFLFIISNVNALTLQEWHMNQNENGSITTYNAWNGAFEYLGQYYNTGSNDYDFTAFLFSSLPYIYTDSLNFYFDNPCSSTEKISYTNRIYFYKVSGADLDLKTMNIVNVIDGCSGYLSYENGQYVYVQNCNLNPNEPLATSLYFSGIPLIYNNATYYRLGIQSDFAYTCTIDEKSLIDNNNANTQQIINSQTIINSSINNVDESIKDDNVDSPSNFFTDIESKLAQNSTISSLITLPITFYTAVLNGVNASCSSFNLGSIKNQSIVLPCIDISHYIGSTLWGVIDILFSGFFILHISRKFIKVFENMSSLKDGDVIDD